MKSREKSAQQFALNLISKWLRSNYLGYVQTNGTMFEKYDAKKVIHNLKILIIKRKNYFHESDNYNNNINLIYLDWRTWTCR